MHFIWRIVRPLVNKSSKYFRYIAKQVAFRKRALPPKAESVCRAYIIHWQTAAYECRSAARVLWHQHTDIADILLSDTWKHLIKARDDHEQEGQISQAVRAESETGMQKSGQKSFFGYTLCRVFMLLSTSRAAKRTAIGFTLIEKPPVGYGSQGVFCKVYQYVYRTTIIDVETI